MSETNIDFDKLTFAEMMILLKEDGLSLPYGKLKKTKMKTLLQFIEDNKEDDEDTGEGEGDDGDSGGEGGDDGEEGGID